MTINNKPSPPTFLHAQETCKNKSAIGSTLLRKRKGEKETLVMAQSENYKQLASVLPHAIINHISLRINKNGEREKITKTDKHHYTPTTRKKTAPIKSHHYDKHLFETGASFKMAGTRVQTHLTETRRPLWRLEKLPRGREGKVWHLGKTLFFFQQFLTSHDHDCWR